MQVFLSCDDYDGILSVIVNENTSCEDLCQAASNEFYLPADEVVLQIEDTNIELKGPLDESDLQPESRLRVRPSKKLTAQREVQKLNIKMCLAQIVSMALHGDIEGLELTMAAGAGQYVTRACDESTCVLAAVEGGSLAIVKYFIQKGYSINSTPLLPGTPISEAALQRNYEIMNYLLQQGADINAKNENGQTALMTLASHDRYLPVIKELIAKGADVSQKSRNQQTLLMVCSYYGSENVCSFLLELGVDVNDTDAYGNTALSFALEERNLIIADILCNHHTTDLSIKNFSGINILHEAVSCGEIDFLTVLLVHAGDINNNKYLNQYGESILVSAIHSGSVEVVELLLSCGSDINGVDNNLSKLARNLKFYKIAELLEDVEERESL